jgi:hypothetical protein
MRAPIETRPQGATHVSAIRQCARDPLAFRQRVIPSSTCVASERMPRQGNHSALGPAACGKKGVVAAARARRLDEAGPSAVPHPRSHPNAERPASGDGLLTAFPHISAIPLRVKFHGRLSRQPPLVLGIRAPLPKRSWATRARPVLLEVPESPGRPALSWTGLGQAVCYARASNYRPTAVTIVRSQRVKDGRPSTPPCRGVKNPESEVT